ncbi:hypothetical protein DFH07DRAFT_939810 [Mycena maculata]|uniref:Uncharacterized protein n=1 Tax=Mycena maculata TaxID=230809 RepID=A0AAD7JC32_9AGAR|nr:hypothetical protein DFH07DRAFT_939810 [Mycena maculata]
MSSTAITHAVSFLTRPLMRVHTPATILSLQLYLQTAFSASPIAPETALRLSAYCPPPPEIQRACLASGVRWVDWITLLSGGFDLTLFISGSSLSVQLGRGPRRDVWVAPTTSTPAPRSPALRLTEPAFGAHLRATLSSARTRRGTASESISTLNRTRIPRLISPSSLKDVSASDSDSGSDCESDASESGYSFTSASSAMSVSSAESSPKPVVTRATRYLYQGGVTQVVSGGVMLGVCSPSTTKPKRMASVPNSQGRRTGMARSFVRKTGVSAADACSWRRSA